MNTLGRRDASCETTIGRLQNHGEMKSFSWEKYTNLHVEQNGIKSMLTDHGFNYWSEAQKFHYQIKLINTNLLETCLANIIGSAAFHDDFYAAARNVAEFLVIMNSCGPGSHFNISGFGTDQGGGGGQVHGGVPGRRGQSGGGVRRHEIGGHGVPSQDVVDACTHITKSYYPVDQYRWFSAAEKQKVWQNKGKETRAAGENTGDIYSIKELNVHIRQMSAVIKIQNKRIRYIKTDHGDEDLMDYGDEKSVLNLPNRQKPATGSQGKGSAKSTKGVG